MIKEQTLILAIESAICGGSISLIRNGIEMANWIGSDSVSKAEDLLPNLNSLLTNNDVSLGEVSMIAVSAGPGSFTGIRIGIATTLGLGRAIDVEVSTISALTAMISTTIPGATDSVAALPVGRNAVCIQSFVHRTNELREIEEPRTLSENDFLEFVERENNKHFVIHDALCKNIGPSPKITNFGENLAFAVGQTCLMRPSLGRTKPLFISKSF